MRILIAGGGVGGLTAALALIKSGHDVTVCEQAARFEDIGAGVQISPNGMKVLERLGVSARVGLDAFRPRAQELRLGRSGRRIFEVPLRTEAISRWGADYLHIHRADLLAALSDAVRELSPGSLRTGHQATGYTQDDEGVHLTLASGARLSGDLLIGADGIHSVIRTQMLGPQKPRFTGHVAWRTVVPVARLGDYPPPETACVWVGKRRHAVTYRLRRGSLANFVGVVERDEPGDVSWGAPGVREDAKADFHGWHPVIRRILDEAAVLLRWPLYDCPPLPGWTDGRVVLLGDACHPMLPFLAQGAVMAIEDAYVLASELKGTSSLPGALSAYERARKARTSRVQKTAEDNARIFHRTNALTQLGTYGPMMAAGRVLPGAIRGRHDWLYGHDVTAGS
jgi:salicylate hydroxylase